jgi:hypothetical protein
MFDDLNFTAVAVSTVVVFIIGFLWYGPFFGNEWMKLVGMKKPAKNSRKKPPMAVPMLKGLINTFIMVTVTSYAVSLTDAVLWQEGALIGVVLAVGLIATVLFSEVNWEKRPVKLFMINSLYYVVALAVTGGIYVAWPA